MHLSDLGKTKSYSVLVGDIWLPRLKLVNLLKHQFDLYAQYLYLKNEALPHESVVAEFHKLIDLIDSNHRELKKVDVNFKLLYSSFENVAKLGIEWQKTLIDFEG